MASDDIEARLWQSADESRMIHGDEITGDLLSSAAEEIAGLRSEVGRLDAEVWRLKVEVGRLKVEVGRLKAEVVQLNASRDALLNACVAEASRRRCRTLADAEADPEDLVDHGWEWRLGVCSGFVDDRSTAVAAVLRTAKNYPK